MGLEHVKSRIIKHYKGWIIVKHINEEAAFCINKKSGKRSYDMYSFNSNHPLEDAIEKGETYIDKQINGVPSKIIKYINEMKSLQLRKWKLIAKIREIEYKEKELIKLIKFLKKDV